MLISKEILELVKYSLMKLMLFNAYGIFIQRLPYYRLFMFMHLSNDIYPD